jgi:hypothetical protein
MSTPTHRNRVGRAGIALVASLAFVAIPATAQAAPVNLATAKPFVVLAGSTVTNTGPSVLNGDLGVAPGTALVGFGLPAVVNGAKHANDGVAKNAKSDLTTAYNVAAGQPVLPANDLTGTNLGNRTLKAGAYRFTSSAQLTGPLTLDAEGDPNAQFVFEIASALTTASASSVVLINGASPCNVYWQVGSSATLGTTTAFQGNLMALTSISLNNGATVIGRLLARNGQISLINNVLNNSRCTTGSGTGGGGPGGGGPGSGGTGDGGSGNGTGTPRATTRNGTAITRRAPRADCTDGFTATVQGHLIARVVFRMDGVRIGNRKSSPFRVFVRAAAGRHIINARVTFKDSTRAKTMRFRYRACAAQVRQPRRGPTRLTG